uniref:Uncharacterized protein n=1 Tax=uncultured bacterium 59 TaxID=698390 RepID=E3T6G3_9BACT|nr:hypothetical protein [uncultured bacterium 59]
MPRFAYHRAGVLASKKLEKSSEPPRVEREFRRQLQQQRAKSIAKTGDFREETP